MKRFLAPFYMLILVVSFTSCTRDYTCQCKMNYEGKPGMPGETIREYPITDTRKGAETACDAKSGTWESNGITTVEECYLW